MFFDRVIIFVSVIVSGYAAMVNIGSDCRNDEVRCPDGRCSPSGTECREIETNVTTIPESARNTTPRLCSDSYNYIPQHDANASVVKVRLRMIINLRPISPIKNMSRRTCVIPSLKHGNVSVAGSASSKRVEVHFVCDPGFTLLGPASVLCVDGVWQGQFPECRNRPVLCEVKKLPQFTYKCRRENGEDSFCDKYVAEGTQVKVARRVDNGLTGHPGSVQISCNSDGVFNISLGCMKEIEILQHEFQDLTKGEMTSYQTNFNKIDQADLQFKESVKNFNHFEHEVKVKLNQMHRKIEECNIYFDLLLTSINQSHQESQKTETNKTCELPQIPPNGTYSVESTSNGESFEAADFTLHYVCDKGFALLGPAYPRCVNGVWLDEFPRCSAACKLVKNPDFEYQCLKENGEDPCGEYAAVGSSVKVTRRDSSGSSPVTVYISCIDNRSFNISSDCVQEIDQLQTDFEKPTMDKMIFYESQFNVMKDSSPANFEFEKMVNEFRTFEKNVTDSLTNMQQKALECDIYLDLMLLKLTLKIDQTL